MKRRCDMKNKQGLSTVITTLIIILLVLIAIGIVWVVVRNLINQGARTGDITTQCLSIDMSITGVTGSCNPTGGCAVTIYRGAGGGNVDGVKMVFMNKSTSTTTDIMDIATSFEPLGTYVEKNQTAFTFGVDNVQITPYIKDSTGKEQLCPQPVSFDF